MTLDEIRNDVTKETPASFEPTVDYIVTKIPRWPFDKFVKADNTLTTAMKSTGEVMAIGRSYEESLMKAVRSLDIDKDFGYSGKYTTWTDEEIKNLLLNPTDERLFAIYQALKRGITPEEISAITGIEPYFLYRIENIVTMEEEIKKGLNPETLQEGQTHRIHRRADSCISRQEPGRDNGYAPSPWASFPPSRWWIPVPPSLRPRRLTTTHPTIPNASLCPRTERRC